MPNNVAEFILRISREGPGEGQKFAAELTAVDEAAKRVSAQAGNMVQGIQGITVATAGGQAGMRAMGAGVAGLASELSAGPMNPAALLMQGRALLFLASATGAFTMTMPLFLGIAGALAAVGFAINRYEADTRSNTQEQQKAAAALDKAREAYKRLQEQINEGSPPSGREAREAIKAQFDALKAAQDQAQNLRDSLSFWQSLSQAARSTPIWIPGEQTLASNKIETLQGQLKLLEARIAAAKADIQAIRGMPKAEPEQRTEKETDARARAIEQEIDLEKAGLETRKAERDRDLAEEKITQGKADAENAENSLETYRKEIDARMDLTNLWLDEYDRATVARDTKGAEHALQTANDEQAKIARLREEAAAAQAKIEADATRKRAQESAEAAKLVAEAEVRAFEAAGERELADATRIDQQIASERQRLVKLGVPENFTGPMQPGVPRVDLSTFDRYSAAQKELTAANDQWREVVKATDAQLEDYQRKIENVRAAMAAETIRTGEGRREIAALEDQIKSTAAGALPKLDELKKALEAIAKKYNIQIDTREIDAAAAKLQHTLDAPAPKIEQNQTQQLLKNWSDLGQQVDQFRVRTLEDVANTSTKVFNDMLTRTGNVRKEFANLVLAVIDGIIKMMVQWAIAQAAGLFGMGAAGSGGGAAAPLEFFGKLFSPGGSTTTSGAGPVSTISTSAGAAVPVSIADTQPNVAGITAPALTLGQTAEGLGGPGGTGTGTPVAGPAPVAIADAGPLNGLFSGLTSSLSGLFSGLTSSLGGLLGGIGSAVGGAASGVGSIIGGALGGIGMLFGLAHGGTPRFGPGGKVWGAGSATSDSIPAYLSAGEFVHRAAAHEYYGTPAMHALNAMSIPREAVHAAMERRSFALGGAASIFRGDIPSFAAGGIAVRLAGGGFVPDVHVAAPNVILAMGNEKIDELMATSRMQQHLTDHLVRNAHLVNRSTKKAGGHRQE